MRPGQPHGRTRVRWVATVPAGAAPPRRASAAEPYAGPPRYATTPRWGFPNLAWRVPTAVPGVDPRESVPLQRLRMVARNAVALLWTLAGLAVVAGGAEIWRYVLLVQSRNSALSPTVVGASDALVLAFSLLTFVLAVFAAAVVLWWFFVARSAAADEAGQEPARPTWFVLLGLLTPGPNLVLAGPILGELEHAALRRSEHARPRPSWLVLGWWAAWVANGVLLVLTVLWRMRDGVQADADGVVLSALTDLCAAGLAVLTALVVQRVTSLLAPIDGRFMRLLRVVKVSGAPNVERRPRAATAPR
ncbi:DUF4328 domain-containing protein [Saccharomonospora sp. NPDC006951]